MKRLPSQIPDVARVKIVQKELVSSSEDPEDHLELRWPQEQIAVCGVRLRSYLFTDLLSR